MSNVSGVEYKVSEVILIPCVAADGTIFGMTEEELMDEFNKEIPHLEK